jgi:hypothetical protein
MRHLNVGGQRQQHAHQVRHIADAEGTVVDPAGIRLGARDEILDRTDAGGGIGHGAQRIGRGLRDRHEVAKRVVGKLLVDESVGRDSADRRVDQRIAVGSRLCARIHADDGVRARAIVDDTLLAPQLAHLLRKHPRLQVDAGPGSLRHNNADGAVGIFVDGLCDAGRCHRKQR